MKRFSEKSNVLFLNNVDGKTGKEWDVVLIEAGWSLNEKFYSRELLEKSVGLFEGVKCCAFLEGDDFHHRDERDAQRRPSGSAKNTVGWFENVKFGEFDKPDGSKGVGILARFKILEGQDWLSKGMRDAFGSGKTDLLGFSIDAHGELHHGFQDGKEGGIVESITQVDSTDVVTDPAAGGKFIRIAASQDNKDKKGFSMKKIKDFAEKHGIKQKDGESDDDFTSRVLESKLIEAENTLGNMLRKAMEAKGLSTADLGKAAGIDAGTVAQILSGSIKRPPDARLKGFARVTGLSFEQLLNAIPSDMRESIDGAYISELETELVMKTEKDIKEAQDKLAEDQKKFQEEQKASRIKESQLLVKEALIGSDLPEQAQKKITEKFDGQEEVTKEHIEEAIKEEKAYIASFKESTGDIENLGDAHDDDDDALKKAKVGKGLQEKFAKAWDGFYEMEDVDGVPKFSSLNEAWRAYNQNNHKAHGSREMVAHHIFESMARAFPGKIVYDFGDPYERHERKLKENWGKITSETLREASTTSDFSVGFGQAMFRRLQKEYSQDPRNDWRKVVSSIENLQDATNTFSVVRTGETKELPIVAENGDYQELHPTRAEEVEVITPEKRGGLEIVSWETVLADRIGIIRKIPRNLARASNLTIHKSVWNEIESNPTMQDSKTLFHADHNNIISGDPVISYANAVVGITALRNQTALESLEKLGLMPKFLMTAVEQEAVAEEIIESLAKATSAEDATVKNVLKSKFAMEALGTIGLGVTAGTTKFWYIAASPKDADTIAVGFLGGRDRPDIFVQGIDTPNSGSMFDADKITYKVRLVHGARVVDHRWIQRSANT